MEIAWKVAFGLVSGESGFPRIGVLFFLGGGLQFWGSVLGSQCFLEITTYTWNFLLPYVLVLHTSI